MKYDITSINKVNLFDFIEANFNDLKVVDQMEKSGTTKKVYESQNDKFSVYKNPSGVYYYFNNKIIGGKSGSIIDFVIYNKGGVSKCSMAQALEFIKERGVPLKQLENSGSGLMKDNRDATQKPLDDYYKIDLRDFILSVDHGYTEDLKEGTKRFPIIRKYDASGKCISKIVITQDRKGFYAGYDKKNGDEKITITSFIQDLHGGREVFNLGKVRGFLEAWLGNQNQKNYHLVQKQTRKEIEKPFNLNEHISTTINTQYFKMRGISTNLLNDPTLKPIIGTKEKIIASNKVDNGGARILNTAYVVRDIDRKPIGVILKNKNIDNETFSGAIGERGSGLIYNDFDNNKPSKVFVTESFDDALSYYQLKHDNFKDYQKILVATAGEVSFKQYQLFNDMFKEIPDLKIITGFDNDLAGKRFNCGIIGSINPEKLKEKEIDKSFGFTIHQAHEGKNILIKFETAIIDPNKQADFQNKIKDNLPITFQTKFEAEIFKSNIHINSFVKFENTEENLDLFAKRMLELRYDGKLKEIIQMDHPKSKDFNKDLQDLLGITDYNNSTQKFWEGPTDLKGNPKEEWMKVSRLELTINPELADKVKNALDSGKIYKAVRDEKLTGQNAIQIIKKATGAKIPFNIVAIRDEQLKKKGYNLEKTVKSNINQARKRNQLKESSANISKSKEQAKNQNKGLNI